MVLCVATMAMVAGAQTLSSPDGRLTANVQLKDGCICYSIQMNGQTLLEEGRATLNCGGKAAKPKFSRVTSKREVITAPHYRQAEFTAEWKEMRATLGDGLAVTFRMFNDGLAYRFETSKKNLIIKDETAQWELPETAPTWMAFSTNKKKPFEMAFQNVYSAKPFGEQPSEMAFLPVTIDLGAAKMTILEADVEAYPGVFVCKDGSKLKAHFAAYPKEMGKHPWRGMSFVSEREDYIRQSELRREVNHITVGGGVDASLEIHAANVPVIPPIPRHLAPLDPRRIAYTRGGSQRINQIAHGHLTVVRGYCHHTPGERTRRRSLGYIILALADK